MAIRNNNKGLLVFSPQTDQVEESVLCLERSVCLWLVSSQLRKKVRSLIISGVNSCLVAHISGKKFGLFSSFF